MTMTTAQRDYIGALASLYMLERVLAETMTIVGDASWSATQGTNAQQTLESAHDELEAMRKAIDAMRARVAKAEV